jgi:hypothetical protein
MKSKITVLGASLAGLTCSAWQASAITSLPSAPPAYGAYVVGYDSNSQVFENGVLGVAGNAAVESASGTGGGITASADLATGDIEIVGSSSPGNSNVATALFFTQVTFTGSGTGTINFNGTLGERDGAHAEEYVGLLNTAPTQIEAGYSIPRDASLWSASSISPNLTTFTYTTGETAYLFAQLSAGTYGGSVAVTDPFSLDLSPGTSFTAAAPQFLSPVPEPTTWAMLLSGLFGIGFMVRVVRGRNAVPAV